MFTGNFTASQAQNLTTLIINDTSDYSSEGQATFSNRLIYLNKADGSTLVPDGSTFTYIPFPFSLGNVINIDVLDRDYALSITIVWVSNAPQPGSTYTKSQLYAFTFYTKQFIYGLVQEQTAKPNIVNDVEYFSNLLQLMDWSESADYAVGIGGDIQASQLALDQAYNMISKQNLYF